MNGVRRIYRSLSRIPMVVITIVVSISNGSRQPPSNEISYGLTKHIDWGKYAEAIIGDGKQSVEVLPPREEYQFLSELIISSALQLSAIRSARARPIKVWRKRSMAKG